MLAGVAAAVASLGLLVTVSTVVTRRYDRRKLRQAALHSSSVSSAGILLQRDDEPTLFPPPANGTGSVTSFTAVTSGVTFENRAALTAGMTGDCSDDCDFVAM